MTKSGFLLLAAIKMTNGSSDEFLLAAYSEIHHNYLTASDE